jgi:hypothetical protein
MVALPVIDLGPATSTTTLGHASHFLPGGLSTVNRSIALRPNDRITLAIGRLTPNYPANYRRLTGLS